MHKDKGREIERERVTERCTERARERELQRELYRESYRESQRATERARPMTLLMAPGIHKVRERQKIRARALSTRTARTHMHLCIVKHCAC